MPLFRSLFQLYLKLIYPWTLQLFESIHLDFCLETTRVLTYPPTPSAHTHTHHMHGPKLDTIFWFCSQRALRLLVSQGAALLHLLLLE